MLIQSFKSDSIKSINVYSCEKKVKSNKLIRVGNRYVD